MIVDELQESHYTVLLVFPRFGTERENAETVMEMALDWLNANREKPGFRFAPVVSAHLEIVGNVEEARDKLDEDVAMVFLHDLDEEERDALARECQERHISLCFTVEVPRTPTPPNLATRLVLRKKDPDAIHAHSLSTETLNDPVEEDEDTE